MGILILALFAYTRFHVLCMQSLLFACTVGENRVTDHWRHKDMYDLSELKVVKAQQDSLEILATANTNIRK